MSHAPFKLLGHEGTGSAIVEAAFALAGLPCEVELVDPWKEGATRERLRSVNPLGAIPTMVLPDGTVMTESAAILLYANDLAPEAALIPGAGHPERARFLRWFVFLVSEIYPTFTYGDLPGRYVSDEAAQRELRRTTNERRESLWELVEEAATGPWFLGAERTAIDLYVWVMNRWRPRRPWFAEHAPKLAAIAAALDEEPRLAMVRSRNFSD